MMQDAGGVVVMWERKESRMKYRSMTREFCTSLTLVLDSPGKTKTQQTHQYSSRAVVKYDIIYILGDPWTGLKSGCTMKRMCRLILMFLWWYCRGAEREEVSLRKKKMK